MEESNFEIEIDHTTKVEDNYILTIILSSCVYLNIKSITDHACFVFCLFIFLGFFFQLAWPALFVAVKNGHEEIVEYLVEKGADISYQKNVSYKYSAKL